MGLICTIASIPTFESSCCSNTEATSRWQQFNEDPSQPGSLVTFFGEDGEARGYRYLSASLHFEVARDLAVQHCASVFPLQAPLTVMISGRCFEPACPDFGQRDLFAHVLGLPANRAGGAAAHAPAPPSTQSHRKN